VLNAQLEAIAAAKGGMPARELDAVARRSIKRSGYGKYFIHSLGHGLGLHVHERPRVSSLSKEELQAGNVITIEPGVYIPGFGGVRIEDDVLVTAHGCRVLTRAPKELMIV
jgi:Xaa-Pro aminopeptidase